MSKVYLVVILCTLLLFVSCNQSSNKSSSNNVDSVESKTIVTVDEGEMNTLSDVVIQFVNAYVNKDNHKVKRLIHPDLGLDIIYKPGVSNHFVHVDSLDFSKPVPDYYEYPEINSNFVLKYESLPVFDCVNLQWNKTGLICDTTSHPNVISDIISFEKSFNTDNVADEEVIKIKNAEKETFCVILTSETPLVFHIRKYEGKWYVSAIDRSYGDCDA